MLVFMLISLINMNKIINQIWFSMYHKMEPVPRAPGASFPWLDIVGQCCLMYPI